ncbi:predicted protein [Postia placenta Mad-698-R]|nr:predicted protein [Postia placenta Mad-698-R]
MVPMPLRGSKYAPRFRGKQLETFLIDFEKLAKRAGLKEEELPTEVLTYCSSSVCDLLRKNAAFKGNDWNAAKKVMRLFYRDKSDEQVTVLGLREFSERMRRKQKVGTSRALDEYAIAFGKRMGDLVSQGQLTEKERDVLFYRGLGGRPLIVDPPSMEEVLKAAQDLFNVLNIDYDPSSGENEWDSDTDSDEGGRHKNKRKKTRVVKVKTEQKGTTIPDTGALVEQVTRLSEQIRQMALAVGQASRKVVAIAGGVTIDLLREGLVKFASESGRLAGLLLSFEGSIESGEVRSATYHLTKQESRRMCSLWV